MDIEVLFHLHIPKTAGTALREAFKRSLPLGPVLEWYPANPYQVDSWLPELKEELAARNEIRVVTGHFVFGAHRALPDDRSFKYFTVLRDPIERVLSQYIHDLEFNLTLIPRKYAIDLITSEFISCYASHHAPCYFYNNLQTRFVSGIYSRDFNGMSSEGITDLCCRNIEEHFCKIAFQTNLTDHLWNVFRQLGVSEFDLREENSRQRLLPTEHLPPDEIRRLLDLNLFDWSLTSRFRPDLPTPIKDEPAERNKGAYALLRLKAFQTALKNLLS